MRLTLTLLIALLVIPGCNVLRNQQLAAQPLESGFPSTIWHSPPAQIWPCPPNAMICRCSESPETIWFETQQGCSDLFDDTCYSMQKFVPLTKKTTSQVPADAANDGGTLSAKSVGGINGINGVKLLQKVDSALGADSIRLKTNESYVLDNTVRIVTTIRRIGAVEYGHVIHATINPSTKPGGDDKIDFTVYSYQSDGTRAPTAIPENIWKDLKAALTEKE